MTTHPTGTKRGKLTPKMRACLSWFASQSKPVGWFDAFAPSKAIRVKAQLAGFIEPVQGKSFVQEYTLTDSGRSALTEAGHD